MPARLVAEICGKVTLFSPRGPADRRRRPAYREIDLIAFAIARRTGCNRRRELMTDYAAFLNALVIASAICARFYSKRRNKRALPPPDPRNRCNIRYNSPLTQCSHLHSRARRKVSAVLPRRSGRFMARARARARR